MKTAGKAKAPSRSPSPKPVPDLSQALKVQELRTYIEREKGKQHNEPRFKDAPALRQPRSRPSSATSPPPVPPSVSSISRFLSDLGLSRYSSLFSQKGIEDLETAAELTETDLEGMGIALGHRIKLLKRLHDLFGPKTPTKGTTPHVKPPLPPVKPSPTVQSGHPGSLNVNERVGCWECYRTFFREVGESIDGKLFCTKKCSEKYRQTSSITCPCGTTALKSASIHSEGVYYCSSHCISSSDRTTSTEEPSSVVNQTDQDDIDDRASDDFTITDKIKGKYGNKGQATIKEATFEGTQPDLRVLMESVKEVKGWDAPLDASFDLEHGDFSS